VTIQLVFKRKTAVLCLLINGFLLPSLQGQKTENNVVAQEQYHIVMARKNVEDSLWKPYVAKTIDRLPGFKQSSDPATNKYGGWKTDQLKSAGFFRTDKKDGRWWLVDPLGNPFIHKGVAVLNPGNSDNQKNVFDTKYQTGKKWIAEETQFLRQNGFNGAGAWSNVDLIRNSKNPLVYTVIVSPMGAYKADHIKKYGGKYEEAGWQGYRYDLVMVFDRAFEAYVEREVSKIEKYKSDKHLLGYFTDNELPWVDDALDRHLKFLSKNEEGYIAAKQWLDKRKRKDATLEDITDADRQDFTGFYFETYMKKVTAAIRKYDPNHLYLGCRFNQELDELDNPKIFEVAGRYMDVISINHYRKWEPEQKVMADWMQWSGKPFIITEWYNKGEDSGLPNKTGAGWNVATQQERGYFYQNFVIELLKSKACVGWHWFRYQDNDPENLKTDYSNRDSNKGIINSNFEPYRPLTEQMKQMNENVYRLIQYLDSER